MSFFHDHISPENYHLSIHDALPILFAVSPDGAQIAYYLSDPHRLVVRSVDSGTVARAISLEGREFANLPVQIGRAQSELQSHSDIVCRILLEKKKNNNIELHSYCHT